MLVRNGWSITNLACSLGRPADHERRRSELARAVARLGISSIEVEPPVLISESDDLELAEEHLVAVIDRWAVDASPDVVVSPSLHDLHHGHEVVARAVRRALELRPRARWWQYAVWGDLPFPVLYIPLDPRDTETALYALGSYAGEHQRNDYRDLLSGGWIRNRALGAEKVFGFGAGRPVEARAVELAAEWLWDGTQWWSGATRVLTPEAALAEPSDRNAVPYLAAPSVSVHRPRSSATDPTS
jgi:LmbE family N-acetylglucosaminyl deacetylase